VLRDRVVLNLGLVLADRGEIPADLAARAAGTAQRLRDVAVRGGASEVIAIATSALRDSPNRADLERILGGALERPVGFIDGQEEARLTFAGVRASVALEPGPALLLDLGGGSLEVALADERGLRWGVSLPIGAGRLTGSLVAADPPTRAERKAVREAVGLAIASVVGPIDGVADGPIEVAVASGGTAGALARLIAARRWSTPPSSLNGFVVSVDELRRTTDRLSRRTLAERLEMPGIDERRAELLPAGGWILTEAAMALGVRELVHSEWGLREGIILDALGLADDPAPPPMELRRASVERLVRQWGEDRRHLRLVRRLAVELFDALADEHRLAPGDRELLEHAALLHEVGNSISPAKYHKHGAYLVENAGLRGFDPDEISVIASIVRFQRGKDPRPVFAPFADLPEERREAATMLTAVLRLAHAIGRGDEPDELAIAVKVRARGMRVRVTGSTHPNAVVGEATDASSLLGRLLDRSVEVTTRSGEGDDVSPDEPRSSSRSA
jgi:exopolyphosphatase / guanosine-5'-triphosphate,3'-diphosphate pyrophosphatase